MPLREYALTLPPIGFALRSVQTHISKQFHIMICVCTHLKANTIDERVRAQALKGKKTLAYYGVPLITPIDSLGCLLRASTFCSSINLVHHSSSFHLIRNCSSIQPQSSDGPSLPYTTVHPVAVSGASVHRPEARTHVQLTVSGPYVSGGRSFTVAHPLFIH